MQGLFRQYLCRQTDKPQNPPHRHPPITNSFHLILGVGRVFAGYLLVGEIRVNPPLQNRPIHTDKFPINGI